MLSGYGYIRSKPHLFNGKRLILSVLVAGLVISGLLALYAGYPGGAGNREAPAKQAEMSADDRGRENFLARLFGFWGLEEEAWRFVLGRGFPLLLSYDGNDVFSWSTGVVAGISGQGGERDGLQSILEAQIPMLRWPGPEADLPASSEVVRVVAEAPLPDAGRMVAKGQDGARSLPLVAIYNTHNAEAYLPSEGVERRDGENAGIVQVAATLGFELENLHHVPVVRSETLHDYPDWNFSYVQSEKTVKAILRSYPSVQMVIDVHRDAGLDDPETLTLNGQQVAKILFIVGRGVNLPHPNWTENLHFARQVASKMDELYPGLSRGVRIQDGRYNQHLHPRSLLVEIGNSKNSLEEARAAVQLFSRVVAEVLKDIRREQL